MRRSFKDSIKSLEADIQHANTLALGYPRESDGACLQMRLSYSAVANFFLFLVQWTDCIFAGQLGFLRILIYKAYMDGRTTMSIYERKASIKEFYGIIFPSLLLLDGGLTDVEERKQREICSRRFKRSSGDKGKHSEIDLEREEECGICMEINSKVVLPTCCHTLCLKCYGDWCLKSQSCPFCRDSLKSVYLEDLWIYTDSQDTLDTKTIVKENLTRLFMYIDKLPVVVADNLYGRR